MRVGPMNLALPYPSVKPIQNTGILILDKNNQPVPLGAGELCISGVNGAWLLES